MRNWFPAARRSQTSTRRCASLFALLAAALAACASPALVHSSTGARIYDVHARRFVTEAALVADLATARYRLLGEVHDNPAHHVIRARLVAEIAQHGLHPAVVMEQFDLDHDAALQAAQAAGVDAEALASAGRLDRKGWHWPLHAPIIEAALARHLPVRAGNLSRATLRVDGSEETNAGAPSWRARLVAARWSDQQARDLHAEIVDSHCGLLPRAVVPRLVLAQRERDAAMAQALVADATRDGAILIAGNGHVRADRGVPVYLHAVGLPDAGARSLSVGMIEVEPSDEHASGFPGRIASEHPGFDYLWLTRKRVRPDPCADFEQGAAKPGT
jgi:uncharacterized iron-regulated protein